MHKITKPGSGRAKAEIQAWPPSLGPLPLCPGCLSFSVKALELGWTTHSKAGHITCEVMMGGEHLNSTLSQPSFEDSVSIEYGAAPGLDPERGPEVERPGPGGIPSAVAGDP